MENLYFVNLLKNGVMYRDYFINKFWTTKSKWYHKGNGHFNWALYHRILAVKSANENS